MFGEARQKMDYDGRALRYAKCLRRLQENPPWLYVAHPHVVRVARADLDVGVSIAPSGVLTLDSV